MAKENKNIALVILGIVAVIAVIGLVLLFTGGNKATGEGIYGGAIKRVEYPYWQGRGVPMGGREEEFRTMDYRQASTNWNFYGTPKRAPYDIVNPDEWPGNVPSTIRKGGSYSICVGYSESNLIGYYQARGATCYPKEGQGQCCYFPDGISTGTAGRVGDVNLGRTPYGYG